jgi:PRTRC genetic system protein E
MFTELKELIDQGKKHLTLIIAPAGDDKLLVTLKPTPKDSNEAEVLNRPLQVTATPDQLDEGYAKSILKYKEVTVSAGDNLREIEAELKKEEEERRKKATAKKTPAKKAAKKAAKKEPEPEKKKPEPEKDDGDDDLDRRLKEIQDELKWGDD